LIIYVDTSVIVAALTMEAHSERAIGWLLDQSPGVLVISPWVETEFASAIGIKRRANTFSARDFGTASSAFQKLVRDYCTVIPVNRRHFDAASHYLADIKLGLRSGDALHLAIAASNGASLCTLDQRLFDAGRALGVPCTMP
jgi:uncharacterized protein